MGVRRGAGQNGPIAHTRMDDVEDNSELRRGIPVSHTIYGVPQTINTANYVYFLAMQELIKMEGPKGGLMGTVTGEWGLRPCSRICRLVSRYRTEGTARCSVR